MVLALEAAALLRQDSPGPPGVLVVDDERTDGTAAAARGCILVRRPAREAAGGIDGIRGEIVADCAPGRLVETRGRIRLGLASAERSIRPDRGRRDVRTMVAGSAYAQPPLRALVLPAAGLPSAGMTLDSARRHARGRKVTWTGRPGAGA